LQLKNPLAGLLYCPHCNKAMVYQGYNKRPETAPRYLHAQSRICKVKSATVSDVMDAVVQGVKMYIEDFQVKADNIPDVNEAVIENQVAALKAEQKSSEKKLAKLFDAWEDGNITDNEFVHRKAVHNEKIESIKQQIAAIEDSVPEKEEYKEIIESLHTVLEKLTDPDVDAEVQNQYMKSVFSRIDFIRENKQEFILDLFLR
jgi:hypothetical protein